MENSLILTLGLPISLGIIMFGMGINLTIKDFKSVFTKPKATFLGLMNQLILVPITAFVLVQFFELSSTIGIGLVIIAACPGGPTSNLISHICKGDTALSISLTALTSIITVFTIPLYLTLAFNIFDTELDKTIKLPIASIIKQLTLITILPVSIGMLFRRFFFNLTEKIKKPMKIISVIILSSIIAGLLVIRRDDLIPYFKQAGIITLVLNILTMTIGYYSSKIVGLKFQQAITITVESGIQNATLAIVIATSILQNTDMAIPAAIYTIFMYISSAFLMVRFSKK